MMDSILEEAFNTAIRLSKQLHRDDYINFPHLAQCEAILVNTYKCIDVLSTVQNEFPLLFTDVHCLSQKFKTVRTPCDFSYVNAPSDVTTIGADWAAGLKQLLI